MKKTCLPYAILAVVLSGAPVCAQDTLSSVLPLLQASARSTGQNQQVLDLFASAQKPELVFAAGASLVRIPPATNQENRLLALVIRGDNTLKQLFAAVILTAMGAGQESFSPLLQAGTHSQDPAVRAYAAAAYTVLHPTDSQYLDSLVNLYIYDPAFAKQAMDKLTASGTPLLTYLTQAAKSKDAQVRAAAAAWLGDLQTPQGAKQLLKMAKTESAETAATALAVALAKNRIWTLEDTVKGLKSSYKKQPAATYALALGFMPGYAVEPLRQALEFKNTNTRINAARAAAYMAGVLASPQASQYSTDTAFDVRLLKSLIAPLTALSAGNAAAKTYADNALKQIAKLK